MQILIDPRFWWLGSACRYEDNHRGGTFGRGPSMVSQHTFGWDKQEQCFVISDDLFIAGTLMNRFPAPIESAEAFLIRCTDPVFQNMFLSISAAREPCVEEIPSAAGNIRVERGAAILDLTTALRYASLPGLSVVFPETGSEKSKPLHLFNDLRVRFGTRIAPASPDEIRSNLRS